MAVPAMPALELDLLLTIKRARGSPAPHPAARNRRGDASGDEAPFRLGNRFANELQGEARVAVDKVDSHGLAIDDRQRVAQLVSDVALVARLEQRLYEGEIEVVLEVTLARVGGAPLALHDRPKNRPPGGFPFVLAAKMGLDLKAADIRHRLAEILCLLVLHDRRIEADLHVR